MILQIDLAGEVLRFLLWFAAMVGFVGIHYIIYALLTDQGKKIPVPDAALEYTRKPDCLPSDGYFIDLHGHTLASDGWMTPEQLVKWHIANSFNAFVLTDHNTSKNNKEILALQSKYPQILIIPGFEWTSERLHLNFIGIEDYPHHVPSVPTDEEIQQAIMNAKALGAVVLVDHVTWTMDQPRLRSGELIHPTREQLLDWGADGFEINNEMYWHDPTTARMLDDLHHEWKGRKLFSGTGTDIHNPFKEWATGWTELLRDPSEQDTMSIETVKRILLDGRTKVWQHQDYHKPYEAKFWPGEQHPRAKFLFVPFIGTVQGAVAVGAAKPKKVIGSYIIWLVLAYIPIRLLFWLFLLV
ncbi:MAG TPA: CehA/McbA family metallohydrolase [Candidatus Lokiarchaeia archaeon]|nr:CehA/McbA family metallohydrolase [Candidatus Lokiarchaeia archaeon]